MGSTNFGFINISHLLFVDDMLSFCKTDLGHIQSLRALLLLLCFEAVCKLKLNLVKSKMVLVGGMRNIPSLASILGCKVASLPMKYFGRLLIR